MAEAKSSAAAPNDAELVERLLAGDEAAFLTLVRDLHGSLHRIAMIYAGNTATAEEIVQDTWVAALRGLPTFERRSRFKTWLFHILTNRAKTRAVRDKRMVPFSAIGDGNDDKPGVDPTRFDRRGGWAQPPVDWRDCESRLGDKQLVALLEPAIARLPPNQRTVVTMRDIEGLDADEVCNVLGITETNQRVLLHRARTRLRAELEVHLGK